MGPARVNVQLKGGSPVVAPLASTVQRRSLGAAEAGRLRGQLSLSKPECTA